MWRPRRRCLAGEVGIDFIAGPTEILILAADGDARVIAADMLAQAEHDVTASAMLLTTSESLADAVARRNRTPVGNTCPPPMWPRGNRSTNAASFCVFQTMEEAVDVANQLAPEHLSLHDSVAAADDHEMPEPFFWVRIRRNRRAITPPAPATCCPPAARRACAAAFGCRFRQGDRGSAVVTVGLAELAPTITTLARAEGLEAHARAVEVRSAELKTKQLF